MPRLKKNLSDSVDRCQRDVWELCDDMEDAKKEMGFAIKLALASLIVSAVLVGTAIAAVLK